MECQYCGSISKTEKSLIRHQRESAKCKRARGERTKYICEKCDKDFCRPSRLAKHSIDCKDTKNIFTNEEYNKLLEKVRNLENEILELKDENNYLKDMNEKYEKMEYYNNLGIEKVKMPTVYEICRKRFAKRDKNKGSDVSLIRVDKCIPLTDKYVMDMFQSKYTERMFRGVYLGLIGFIKEMLCFGRQRNYVCTDESRKRHYRLIIDDKGQPIWDYDSHANMIDVICDKFDNSICLIFSKELKKFADNKNKTFVEELRMLEIDRAYELNKEMVRNKKRLKKNILKDINIIVSYDKIMADQ